MEMKRIQNDLERNRYKTDFDYVRGVHKVNGIPIQIKKLNEDNFYDNFDNFSSGTKEKMILNDYQRQQEYEIMGSPIDNKLEVDVNNNNNDNNEDNKFKRKESNETVDINFLVNNLNRIEKKNSTLKNIDDGLIHRKFDSLHAFYIESIRLMKFFTSSALYPNVDNPLDVLNTCNYAIVIQKVEVYEILAGCQTKNRYKIYVRDNNGNLIYLFKCKENSSYCARTCLSEDSRPFHVDIKFIRVIEDDNDNFENKFITFKKECICSCFCINRPKLICKSHLNQETLGEIFEPYRCCDPFFKIINKNKEEMFDIHTDCYQKGIACRRFSCGKYAEVKFNIFKGNVREKDMLEQNTFGNIIRRVPKNVEKSVLSDSDNFEINFPPEATAEEKLLILGSTLLIDYRFFENQSTYKRSAYLY